MFAREGSAGSDKQTAPPAHILVVEDDFVVAAGIERALSDARFDVAGVAASADEAVELAESQKAGKHGLPRLNRLGRRMGTRKCTLAVSPAGRDSISARNYTISVPPAA